jgi:hypothetical protein
LEYFFWIKFKLINFEKLFKYFIIFDIFWGLGIGDWGLGIGDWEKGEKMLLNILIIIN